MSGVGRLLKQRVLKAIELLPWGRDIWLALAGERVGICYRGKYPCMSAARAAISVKKNAMYDVINKNKANNAEQEKRALDTWFHDYDYPLLFWFSRVIAPGSAILELGGSVGHFFYTLQHYIELPQDIRWQIAELPEAVSLGSTLAQERGENRLRFLDSANINSANFADIFLTAGTLQYMERSLPEILAALPTLPTHVLSHHLPMHSHEEYVTLQNLGVCELPYRVYSRSKLEAAMQSLGYTLKASWKNNREIEIPFHRDLKIEGYCGHYFVRAVGGG